MTDTPGTRVRHVTAGILGVDPAEITAESDLRSDLHMDSLDAIELVMAMEEEFGIEIADEGVEAVRTFGDLLGLVSAPVEA